MPDHPPSRPTSEPDKVEQLSRGTTLGRHVILDRLGSGGMGVVYAAYDPSLDRKVALKLLQASRVAEKAPGAGQGRLLREAQAMARLSHPNVLSVFDVGSWGDHVFMAMEHVDGVTLRRWLEDQPRGWREVRDVFTAAGRGLAAAHAAGLVHRDFKPDNVMVGKDGRVRVMDFGLARALAGIDSLEILPEMPSSETGGSGPLLSTALTEANVVMGTPRYMAPEQRRGTADARVDQYSFCVAFYEALFGELPTDISSRELLAATGTGSAASARAPGTRPAAPRPARPPSWLKRVLLRGLSKDPAKRFPSMEALLQALSKDPTSRRKRTLAAVAGAVLVAAAGAGLWGGHPPAGAAVHRSGAQARSRLVRASTPGRRGRVQGHRQTLHGRRLGGDPADARCLRQQLGGHAHRGL